MSISTFKSNTYWMDVDLLLLGLQGHVTFENVSGFQGQLRHETKWMRIYLFSHGNISISGVDKDYRWHEGGWKPNVFPYASSSEPQDLATVPESSCPVDFLELMSFSSILWMRATCYAHQYLSLHVGVLYPSSHPVLRLNMFRNVSRCCIYGTFSKLQHLKLNHIVYWFGFDELLLPCGSESPLPATLPLLLHF